MSICRFGLSAFAALLAAVAAAAGANADYGSAASIYRGLLAGRDVAAEAAAFVAGVDGAELARRIPDERLAADPLVADHEAALKRARALAGRLARAARPWQLDATVGQLLESLEQLNGRQLLLAARARAARERVAGLGGPIRARAAAAGERLDAAAAAVEEQINELHALLGAPVASAEAERDWRARARALHAALAALAADEPAAPPPILRAGDLPFDRPLLNPGALRTTPAITPSYAQQDAPPGGGVDLAATADAPLSDAILAKAAELEHDYVRIFEFVRREITTQFYAGAMKGAEATLRSRAGNDVDQASLLLALYRASNVPGRYVHGVVRRPMAEVGAALGLSEPQQVLTALARAGIAHEPVIAGGQVSAVDLDHTWISVFIPYANYRGVAVDLGGRLWLPLAPAIKDHEFTPGNQVAVAAGVRGDAFVTDYVADRLSGSPLEAVRNEVEAYLAANPVLGAYDEQFPSLSATAAARKLLPASLPFEVIAVTAEEATLSPARQHRLALTITDSLGATVMDDAVPLAALLDRRVTLSYQPATVDDFNVIREFGGRSAVPAYLVRLRPQLSAGGKPVAAGTGDLGMGEDHRLEVRIVGPAASQTAGAQLIAGAFVTLNLSSQLGRPLPEADQAGPDERESRAARLLSNQAIRYGAQWDQAEDELAGLFGVAVVRPLPALTLLSTSVAVSRTQGLPLALQFRGVNLDAALRSAEPIARAGDPTIEYDWMRLAALQGSFLEADIFERQWVVESISADKGLKLAARAGLTVHEVTPANADALIPALAHAPHVRDAVQAWTDRGYHALIPDSEQTLNAWTGSVWHVWNPDLGGSGYFISGGLAGGSTTEEPAAWLLEELASLLNNPYGGEPNTDPLAAARIRRVPATDGQVGQAGQMLERPLLVLVTDEDGRPVQGAQVQFSSQLGNSELTGDSETGQVVSAFTDAGGIAKVEVKLGERTNVNAIYALLDSGDEFSTQLAENWVGAAVVFPSGALELPVPFIFYTAPGDPAELIGMSASLLLGYPGSWVGPVQFLLVDEFGNPISNQDIDFTARPAIIRCSSGSGATPARMFTGGDCSIPFIPGTASCGDTSLTVQSTVFGRYVHVITGDGSLNTEYPIRVTSAGVPPFDFSAFSPRPIEVPSLVAQETVSLGYFSNQIDSAPLGQFMPARRLLSLYRSERLNDCEFRFSQTTRQVGYEVLDNGGGSNVSPLGGGNFEVFLQVGNEPRGHRVRFTLTDLATGAEETHNGEPVWAVEPRVLLVSPTPVPLNSDGESLSPIVVDYEVLPDAFRSTIQVNLLEDGNVIDFKFLREGPNAGAVAFTPGKTLDLAKTYEVELLVNPRTAFEVVSERFPVELTQPIVKSVTNVGSSNLAVNARVGGGRVVGRVVRAPLRFFNDIDIPNERVCRMADIDLELTQAATVTMTFEKLDLTGAPTGEEKTILNDVRFGEGTHRVAVSADDLGTDDYRWTIEAISELDGHLDTVVGSAGSSFVQRNSLPIAHPVVKGVDLAAGSMVASFRDFEIPGLGANLRFSRTYSSGARSEPSVVGAGWSHSYGSRIVRSPCGDYYVSGTDSGTIRFVQDGTGFRPLKGYHGTLIQNAADGTFDFYARAGSRYHYVKRQDDAWWLDSIEDPNGNTTSLAYESKPDAPLLTTVTDASGRQLAFTYERRAFRTWNGDVLINVLGPGGISLDLEYDDFGNLVAARREAGGFDHSYQYLTDSTLANANLLSSYTDEVVSATRRYEYAEVMLTSAIGPVTLDILSSTVAAITEPDGGRTTFSYQPGPWGMNGEAVVTDPRGNATTYTMNEYGAATRIRLPTGTRSMTWETDTDVLLLSETDENGRVIRYTYDADGNVTSTRVGSFTKSSVFTPIGRIKTKPSSLIDFRGQQTTFVYDGRGNLLSETLAGTTTSHTYDAKGNRRTTTDPNGNTYTYAYDANGYLTSQTDPEGNSKRFTWDQRGRKLTETDPNGNRTTFSYDNQDRVTVTRHPDGTTTTNSYDDGARTTTTTDPRGLATATTRDAMGRVIRVRNAAGDVSTMAYDASGNKVSETDFAGRTVTHTFDGGNRRITATEPEGRRSTFTLDGAGNLLTVTITGAGGSRTTSYDYEPSLYYQTVKNDSGLAVTTRTFDGAGNVLTETDPEGRQTTYTYDAFNRTLTQTGPLGSGFRWEYDQVGNLLVETTKNSTADQVRRFAYDGANRQIQMIDAAGGVTTKEYDAAGNLNRTVDPRGNATRHAYNARNWRLQTTDPRGEVRQFEYDANGNLTRETMPNGNVVRHVYDALNRRTQTTDSLGPVAAQTYDPVNNVLTRTDANGNVSTFVYDGLNREVSATLPGGRTTLTAYNVFGEITAVTDPAGNTTNHGYNDLGQRISTTGPAGLSMTFTYDRVGNLLTETDSLGRTESLTYNELNYVTRRTDPLYTQTSTYDLLGNRLSHVNRRGVTSEWQYDRENRVTRYTHAGRLQETRRYDLSGNLLFQTDANGNVTGFEYDQRNQVVRQNRPELAIIRIERDAMGDAVTEFQPAGRTIRRTFDPRRRQTSETDGLGLTTTFEYDGNGNRTRVARPLSAWTYDYDQADRLAAATDGLGNRTTYEYDTRGNRTAITDAGGRRTSFVYDARNRLVQKSFADGAQLTLSYDANDNLIGRTEPNGTVAEFAYDELNREVEQTFTSATDTITVSKTLDGNGNVVQVDETSSTGPGGTTVNAYDGLDRLTSAQDRFGRRVQYQYDPNGNRTRLLDHNAQTTTYSYDGLNRLSTIAVPGLGTFTYQYLANSLIASIAYPNGARSAFTYDLGDRLTGVTNTQGGEVVVSYAYEFDANGNRTRQEEDTGSGAEVTTYGFDGADRLVRVDYPDRSVDYALDAVGNRVLETTTPAGGTPVTRDLNYNARDQLVSIDDSAGPNATFDYDANGNQIERAAANVLTFSYSPRNRLITVAVDGAEAVRFEYDHDGLRMAKESGGNRTEYVYDDGSQIAQTNTLGNTLARFHYGSTRRLAVTTGGANRYLLHDALRSPVAITDQSGALVSRYLYDAWGNIVSQSGADDHPFGFTGMEKDAETGLYYASARYYDPELGRFLSEDPFEGDVERPPSLHRYLYANANPTVFVDPDGLAAYLFDGTDQDMNDPSTVNPSNVGKLAKLYDGLVFYAPGVGTNERNSGAPADLILEGLTGKNVAEYLGGLGGLGGDRRLETAYRNLVLAYNGFKQTDDGKLIQIEPDRDIDIMGFSRGAGLGRAFANMIDERGIPDLTSQERVRIGRGRNQRFVTRYTRTFRPDIRFLGIFDTVGSFGVAGDSDEGNKDLSIAPNVQTVRHAIARDELRALFPLTSAIDPTNPDDPRIVELIFEGVHSDVGGSYPDDDSLSHDALWWMWQQAKAAGVPLNDIPAEDLPVPPSQAVPPERREHTYRGQTWYTYHPRDGGRTRHDSRYNKFSDSPRKIIYRYNRRPPGQEDDVKPFDPYEVTGPEHFELLERISDNPYWIVPEDQVEP